MGKLKKRRGIIDNLQKIESEISALHQSSKKREINKVSGTSDCEQSPAKRQATQEITLTSTPVKSCGYLTLCQPLCFSLSSPTPSTHRETVVQAKKKETVVQVQVDWPSKTKVNILKEGLESLGKMLCRGTYSQIANAVWKHPTLKKHMQQLFLKQIDSECSQLCSSKSPSCIRSPKVPDMKNFSFKKFDEELKTKAPQLSAVLKTASLRKSKREKHDAFWLPSVCMSAAVLLKNRSPYMNLLQLMNTITIYHSGIIVSIKACLYFVLVQLQFCHA